MNEVLPSRYVEIVHRLAVGVEPYDAVCGARAGGPVRVALQSPAGLPTARPLRHPGGRWSIRYVKGLPAQVELLIDDSARRYVPRRLRFPIVPEAEVRAAEIAANPIATAQRTWRPALFPGADYPLPAAATGLRGRAGRAGAAARWVRVEVSRRGDPTVLSRAHGDERGEFLLVIGADPLAPAALPDTIPVTVTVRAARPAPAPADDAAADPLWDLPQETVAPPGPSDPVATGETLPPGYAAGGVVRTRNVDLVPGRILTGLAAFDLA